MWVVSLCLVVAMSYFLARMTTLLVASYFPDVMISARPKTALGEGRDERPQVQIDVESIIKRNFFDATESSFSKTDVAKAADAAAKDQSDNAALPPENQTAVATSLDIKLISTIAAGDGRNAMSSCVIQANKNIDAYRVGDTNSFAPKTKIVRIMPKRVEFLNDNTLEYVDLVDFAKGMDPNAKPDKTTSLGQKPARKIEAVDEQPAADDGDKVQREGNTFKIAKSEVDKALSDLNALYTDIRAVPYFKNGKADGFKLINVKAGSLFEKLGLKRGDVLKSINGTVLDIQSGLKTFNDLKNESAFTLEVERRGVEQTLSYQII